MTHMRRYERLLDLLQMYPQFNSPEDGLNVVYETSQPGDIRHFIVYSRLGTYQFHRCYWHRDQLVSTCDFSTTACELSRLRRLAAQEYGNFVLNQ